MTGSKVYKCVKEGMTFETCRWNNRLGCDCGFHKPVLIELVTNGGMTSLKELPDQEDICLAGKYFDQFDTYAPFNWKGSRRLTTEEMRKLKNE